MHVARWGHDELVKELLNAGALPNIVDINGNTALHHAVIENSRNVAQVLLDAGADPHLGKSPLDTHRVSDDLKQFIRELSSGTDVSAIDKLQETLLYRAASNNHAEDDDDDDDDEDDDNLNDDDDVDDDDVDDDDDDDCEILQQEISYL